MGGHVLYFAELSRFHLLSKEAEPWTVTQVTHCARKVPLLPLLPTSCFLQIWSLFTKEATSGTRKVPLPLKMKPVFQNFHDDQRRMYSLTFHLSSLTF